MSEPKKFVGLHAHTSKSIFDGFGNVEDHLDYVVSNGGDGLAITDHGNMNAASAAFDKQREFDKKGIKCKVITGSEVYYIESLADWRKEKEQYEQNKRDAKEAIVESSDKEDSSGENEEESKEAPKKDFNPLSRRHHMVLLPKNANGLTNMFRLVSKSNREGFYRYPRVDNEMLREHGKDIISLSACIAGKPGYFVFNEFKGVPMEELHASLLDDSSKMQNIQRNLTNHFGSLAEMLGEENVFLELQFNKLPVQHMVNRALIEFSKNTNFKLVAAADSHYSKPEYWRERELYKLIGRQMRGNKDGLHPGSLPKDPSELKCELYPKNASQMWSSYLSIKEGHSFYDDQIVCDSIERSWEIAHHLIGDVGSNTAIKLPTFGMQADVSPFQLLLDKCKEGLRYRGVHNDQRYIDRLKTELRVIRELDFTQYFLTLKAVFETANDKILFGCGRGSGAGSLVNYLLEITDVDPVTNNLIFERFLSLARSKNDVPDIDVDCNDRDELIEILRGKFGTKTVVPISNFNQLQLKSLVKDISKLHEVPFDEVNNLTKKLDADVRPHMNTDDLKGALQLTYQACMDYSTEFKSFMEKYPGVSQDVQALYQQPKAVGRHAGGVILLDDPDSVMPLISVRGEIQTPWSEGMSSKSLSNQGLIKFDFLGLETLRMFSRTITLIMQRHENVKNPTFRQIKDWYNTHLTPSKIDPRDPVVFKNVFHEGKFPGIFQFTMSAAQNFVQQLQPTSVTDIATATAIYRPGPLEANVDKLYIEAIRTDTHKDYGHPIVNEVLKSTKGFVIFQEQIQIIAMKLAGFSAEDSDRLRKAILKRTTKDAGKARTITDELHDKFIEGSVANGYPKHKAEELYGDMEAFAKYGFNCVAGSTVVDTLNRGRVRIDTIKPGEAVLGLNGYVKVLNQFESGVKPTFTIRTEYGKQVTCTLEHRIQTNEGLLTLNEIKERKTCSLETIDGLEDIVSINESGEQETYDITVDSPDHLFYANDILVHNCAHAVSYGYISYQCAWLLTYYPSEWLCAYAESMSTTPENRSRMMAELNALGYKIAPVDINNSGHQWTISENGKVFYPGFSTIKGVGSVAVDEIIANRPYVDATDLMWDENRDWKFHKFNKRPLSALIRCCAFESMGIVGEGKTYSSYAHMHKVMIDNMDLLKKKLKKQPDKNYQEWLRLLDEKEEEWSIEERIKTLEELVGHFDISLLIDDNMKEKLAKHNLRSISEWNKHGLYWFVSRSTEQKVTKTGRTYCIIQGMDANAVAYKITCWNCEKEQIPRNKICIAKINKDDWGYKTDIANFRVVGGS